MPRKFRGYVVEEYHSTYTPLLYAWIICAVIAVVLCLYGATLAISKYLEK